MLELNGQSTPNAGMLSLLNSMEQHNKLLNPLNPPLAALHTINNRYNNNNNNHQFQRPPKSISPGSPPPQLSPQGNPSPSEENGGVPPQLSPSSSYNASNHGSTPPCSLYTSPPSPHTNPHGIETILNRPNPFSMGGLSMGGLRGLGGHMGSLYGGLAGKMAAELTRPGGGLGGGGLYWPGVHGVLQNPLLWRDRIQPNHGEFFRYFFLIVLKIVFIEHFEIV